MKKIITLIASTTLVSALLTTVLINFNNVRKYAQPKQSSKAIFESFSQPELLKMGVDRQQREDGTITYSYSSDFEIDKEKRDYRHKKLGDKIYKEVGSYISIFEEKNGLNSLVQREYDFKKDVKEIKIINEGKRVEYIVENGSKMVFEMEEPNATKLIEFIEKSQWYDMIVVAQ